MNIIYPLLLCLCCSLSMQAQYVFDLKEALYYGEKSVSNVIAEEDGPGMEYTVKLYPIGWSKDGKFAYVYLDPPCCSHAAEMGDPRVLVRIQDMRSDKIIWELDMYDEKDKNVGSSKLSLPLKEGGPLQLKLEEHKIIPQGAFGFTDWDKELPDFEIDLKEYENGTVKIKATSKTQGTKTIFRGKHDAEPLGFFEEGSGSIVGLFKSPYEDRVAVVYSFYYNLGHWEFLTDFGMVGCHLKVGFK
jgi:hypothetical protein